MMSMNSACARLCGEGEGDCDADDQCSGQLECGTNNCATTVMSHFSMFPVSSLYFQISLSAEQTKRALFSNILTSSLFSKLLLSVC